MSELKSKSRKLRWLLLLSLPFLIAAAVLLIEQWRGQWALSHWKRDMGRKGEIFEFKQVPVSAAALDFSNRFATLNREWRDSQRLNQYAWQLRPITAGKSGYHRGSQEPQPPLLHGDATNTWDDLDQLLQQNAATLRSLRELLKNPPSEVGYVLRAAAEHDSFPNYVGNRWAAQRLQAEAMNELHKGNLPAAEENLEALLSLTKLNEEDPTLVAYMIRVAILGLSVDVCWDALQADGWTEPQLAALQAHCVDVDRMLAGTPRWLETERTFRIQSIDWLRSHSYNAWINRYKKTLDGFGAKPLPSDLSWHRQVFHPIWSFAWADQEELEYLRHVQNEIVVYRDGVRQKSWKQLKEQMTSVHASYRAPTAAWRLYRTLPVIDTWFVTDSSGNPMTALKDEDSYPYGHFSRAPQTTMENLTLHEMVIAAIAIKRYELKNGRPPASLDALVPDYLAAVPADLMDGQSLRYRIDTDGSFTLYSIGNDLQDDGGNPEMPGNNWPRDGKDWVWPKVSSK